MSMNFCVNCGNKLSEGLKFCPECGFSLQDDDPISTSNLQEPEELPPTIPPVQKKKHSPMSIMAFIFSLTLIASPLGVLLAIIDLLKNKQKV